MSLELNYKARTVAQAEAKYNQRIKAVMVDFSMGQVGVLTMAFLLEAGGISEDEAYNQIDQVGKKPAFNNASVTSISSPLIPTWSI